MKTVREEDNCLGDDGSSAKALEELSVLANVNLEKVLQKLNDIDHNLGRSSSLSEFGGSFANSLGDSMISKEAIECVKMTNKGDRHPNEVKLGGMSLRANDKSGGVDQLKEKPSRRVLK